MRFIGIVIISLFTSLLHAQPKAAYDSVPVELRNFDNAAFDKYKNDKDFQYDNELIKSPSVWDRFWKWVWGKYEDIVSTTAGRYTFNALLWVIGLGGLAFFLYKVLRMNRLSLFAAGQQAATGYKVESEDIHSIPFEEAISEAMQQGNYRLAIRLAYLQHLKLLADKGMIDWRPDKTNTDYYREISDAATRQAFKNSTLVFEYAWYGSHEVSRENVETLRQELSQLKSRL